MKSKTIFAVCLLLVLVASILLLYRNSILSDMLSKKDVTIRDLTNANVTLAPLFQTCILNNGVVIDEQTIFTDTSGNRVELRDFAKNSSTLIFRYSDRHCKQCVDYALNLLNKSNCNKHNVVYMGDCEKHRIFKKQTEDFDFKGIAIACRSLCIPAEELFFPYFIVIDSTLTIRGIYVPNKASYYQNIDSLNLDLMYKHLVTNVLN